MEKITMFMSNDGKLFDTEKDCDIYEKSNSLEYEAYDKYGNKTDIPFNFIFIKIKSLTGFHNVIRKCIESNSMFNGLELGLPGWYIWNPVMKKYIYYNDISTLKTFIELSNR